MMRFVPFLFLFLLCFSGCQTSSDATVIERSAEMRPIWADGDFSGEGGSEAYLVFKREEVYRLELGMKQVQAAAIRRTKDLILGRARIEFEEEAEAYIKGNAAEVQAEIASAVETVHSSQYNPDEAVSRNVYWENVRLDTSEGPRTYYNVYVLLTVPRSALDAAMFRIAQVLEKSKVTAVKQTAEAVIKEINRFEETPSKENDKEKE